MHSPSDHVLPPWKVLLIGGGSGVGKTMLTQSLAQWFGVSVFLIDDLRLALQQMTTPDQHPGLHVFATDQAAAQRPPEAMRDGLITVGRTLIPAIKMIMAHHIVVPGVGSLIMEGDGILPQVAAAHQFHELKHFSQLTTQQEIQAVFLIEPDEDVLYQQFLARGRGFDALVPTEQRRYVHASWLYGQWLATEAHRYHQPVVPVRPYANLRDRVLAQIGT